jgi:hypothetical protein
MPRALKDQFTNLGAVLPDRVVVVPEAKTYHRPALGDLSRPACKVGEERAEDAHGPVERAVAEAAGRRACRRCFTGAVELAAVDEDSPVAVRAVDRGDDGAGAAADGGVARQRALDAAPDTFADADTCPMCGEPFGETSYLDHLWTCAAAVDGSGRE